MDHRTEQEAGLFGQHYDACTAANPHNDDPRFMSLQNQTNHCILRFVQFTRCARELGEEEVRCKYQYYRAQCCCPEATLEEWMEHRARGSCHLDGMHDEHLGSLTRVQGSTVWH